MALAEGNYPNLSIHSDIEVLGTRFWLNLNIFSQITKPSTSPVKGTILMILPGFIRLRQRALLWFWSAGFQV